MGCYRQHRFAPFKAFEVAKPALAAVGLSGSPIEARNDKFNATRLTPAQQTHSKRRIGKPAHGRRNHTARKLFPAITLDNF
jgi:hypothetical protein